MFEVLLTYMILCGYHAIDGKPVPTIRTADADLDSNSLGFLLDNGYFTGAGRNVTQIGNQTEVVGALKKFQSFVGVPVTGKMDTLTVEYMVKPRCGLADNPSDNVRRKRRYSQQGSSWMDRNLTWALENSNNDGLSDYVIRGMLSAAFGKWQAETDLQFTELVNKPDNSAIIRIRFAQGAHGDPFPFDGVGGSLAHSFFPLNNEDWAGDIHFDDAEVFTDSLHPTKNQLVFQWVALHQIGHALGLDHSMQRDSIMYPYFDHASVNGTEIILSIDDIMGIQSIYGEGLEPPPIDALTIDG